MTVLDLVLIVFFVIIIAEVLPTDIFLLRTWLEIELLIFVLVLLELGVGLDISHSLLTVGLLLLLSLSDPLHPLKVLLHLHVLEMEEEWVDGRLIRRRIWNGLRFRVWHVLENSVLAVLDMQLIDLSLRRRLALMSDLGCIGAVAQEHNVVAIQLLLEAHLSHVMRRHLLAVWALSQVQPLQLACELLNLTRLLHLLVECNLLGDQVVVAAECIVFLRVGCGCSCTQERSLRSNRWQVVRIRLWSLYAHLLHLD